MPRRPERRAGERIARFDLIDLLGVGGNGEVWRVESDGAPSALKIIRATRPSSEPYKRFKREVAAHRVIGRRYGVLPTLDADVPDRPTRQQPAWLLMPIAEPLARVLDVDRSLPSVITAMRDVARVLADLADDNIAHRDLKPDNLYEFDGVPTVGDFGLVELPDTESITGDAQNVGPAFYLAPEMLNAPGSADGSPADVYSFAKTLWVLATGQTYPLPGTQFVGDSSAITTYFPAARAEQLALLIERCTAMDPARRPTMREVHQDLDAWIEGDRRREPARPPDLSAIARELQAWTAHDRRLHDERMRALQMAEDLENRLRQQHLKRLFDDVLVNSGIPNVRGPTNNHSIFEQAAPSRSGFWHGGVCVTVVGRLQAPGAHLASGFGLTAEQDGWVEIIAGHALFEGDASGWQLLDERRAESRLGSAHLDATLDELVDHLTATLPDALERLRDLLTKMPPAPADLTSQQSGL